MILTGEVRREGVGIRRRRDNGMMSVSRESYGSGMREYQSSLSHSPPLSDVYVYSVDSSTRELINAGLASGRRRTRVCIFIICASFH